MTRAYSPARARVVVMAMGTAVGPLLRRGASLAAGGGRGAVLRRACAVPFLPHQQESIRAASSTAQPQGGHRRSCLKDGVAMLSQAVTVEVSPGDVVEASGTPTPYAEHLSDSLNPGTKIFVNMVKDELSHFNLVATATKELKERGFRPVPHVPVAHFHSKDEFLSTLASLRDAGAVDLLVLAGNKAGAKQESGSPPAYADSVEFLKQEASTLREYGIERVALAGHPEGLPWMRRGAAIEALQTKVETLLLHNLDACVTTQFTFNARSLAWWILEARRAMQASLEGLADDRNVSFDIGMPGPTPLRRLRRASEICQVSDDFLPCMLQTIAANGALEAEDLRQASGELGLASSPADIERLFKSFANEAGLLDLHGFVQLLAADAATPRPAKREEGMVGDKERGSGPSVLVQGKTIHPEMPDEDLWHPDEAVLTLAALCEQQALPAGTVSVHLFPFGGLDRCLELARQMRAGSWPHETI